MNTKHTSIGDVVDDRTVASWIHHDDFEQLKVFKGIEGSPDYWQITLLSNKQNEDGSWMDTFGRKTPCQRYTFYKLKD